MRRLRWRPGKASAIALSISVLVLNTAGSLAQSRPDSGAREAAAPAARLPANYRQLMAQYVRAHNHHVIRKAMITRPYEGYGGLFRSSVPAVCVVIFRDNPLGIVVRDNWVMTIENGQVEEVPIGLATCSDLSPFTELN